MSAHSLQLNGYYKVMALNTSSRNLTLDGTSLKAECQNEEGHWKDVDLELEQLLGNLSGNFVWMGKDFGKNARDIRLEGSVLHALLPTSPTTWNPTHVDLNDRVCNKDGLLCYMDGLNSFYCYRGSQNRETEHSFTHFSTPIPVDDGHRRYWDAAEAYKIESKKVENEKALRGLPSFQYPPLPSKTSIRLLKIEDSAEASDAIHCSLIVVDLEEDPHYNALSYTWGTPFTNSTPELDAFYRETTSISCQGQLLSVRQNLHDALRRLRKTPPATEKRGRYNKTPIIQAAEDGHTRLVRTLLLEGADVTVQDCFGETALHYAAEKNRLEIVKILVHAGSSISKLDNSRRTPLSCAKQNKHNKVVEFLESMERLGDRPDSKGIFFRRTITNEEYIWIDALCVNQNDNDEKARQVAMMGRIYQSAKSVIVWLGRERQDVHDTSAEDLLMGAWKLEPAGRTGKLDESILDLLLDDPERYLSPSAPPSLKAAATDWLQTVDEREMCRWLLSLPSLNRSWFERAWVIQELIMGRETTVVCGQFQFSWDMFLLLFCIVDSSRALMRRGRNPRGGTGVGFDTIVYRSSAMISRNIGAGTFESPVMMLQRRRRAFNRFGAIPAMSALSLSRNFNTADARDKVFSILSVSSSIKLSTESGQRTIVPDYAQTARDLFLEVGVYLLQTYGPCILSLYKGPETSTIPALPSWIPDLTIPIYSQSLGISVSSSARRIDRIYTSTIYSAALGLKHQQPVHHTPSYSLLLEGFKWNTVEEMILQGLSDIGSDASTLTSWINLLSKLNGTPAERMELLWRTLISDEALGTHPAQNMFNHFQGWVKFLSCIEMIGCSILLVDEITSKRTYPQEVLYPQKSRAQILATLAQIQQDLSSLCIPLSNTESERWKTLDEFTPEKGGYADWYYGLETRARSFAEVMHQKDISRRLFRTQNGYLGTCPEQTKVGDCIFIIPETSVPYVLRPVHDGQYKLIGEAYVHGIMHGEAVRDLAIEMDHFSVI
ncbi:hypothetical protein BP5796_13151 [Coleophoma crateriformis]|uniref:Cyanovirin-N domain-containing protein n=1 Tax=Coleophoma crateriformis TaxID=565419 RepID=A0A3D8Q494_9HELO|nr:hypothetical protein BP5796_13151 [Coleophoma crateriformis]